MDGWGEVSRSRVHVPHTLHPSLSLSPPSPPPIQARLDALARGRAATAGSGGGFGALSILLVAVLAFVVGQALATRAGGLLAAVSPGRGGWAGLVKSGGVQGVSAHLGVLAKKAKAWAAAQGKK